MMNETEMIMTSIYNTLVELRYPEITKAEPKNIDVTILTGKSRISLLTWLLTEKSTHIAEALHKLKDTALEDKLLKYYSEIGICDNKDTLLGNCSMKEQLPTLKLLLDFTKNVHMESFNNIYTMKESIDDILKVYIDDDTKEISSLCNVEPNLSYSEAIEYFQDLKTDLVGSSERNDEAEVEKTEEDSQVHNVKTEDEDRRRTNEDALFVTEKKKFLEVFSGIETWPVSETSHIKNTSYRMDADIKNIYADFSILKQTLEIKDEISKMSIPKTLNKTDTPLNKAVEEAVICTEEVQNTSKDCPVF